VAWDQSKFDGTVKDYLKEHRSEVWPQCMNKKGYFVARGAQQFSPKVTPDKITAELNQIIQTRTGPVEMGFAIAAKRAAGLYGTAKGLKIHETMQRGGKSVNTAALWHAAVAERRRTMEAGRRRSTGFIKVGWYSVLKSFGNSTGLRFNIDERVQLRGSLKGRGSPATAGNFNVIMENSANAKHETAKQFLAIGEPPLHRAMAEEAASMEKYLAGEMEPAAQRFNRAQH
jgi:hypothetical protein